MDYEVCGMDYDTFCSSQYATQLYRAITIRLYDGRKIYYRNYTITKCKNRCMRDTTICYSVAKQ